MRGRSVVGNAVPAWLVPASRLHCEPPRQGAVHALTCSSGRVVPRSHASSLLGEALEKGAAQRHMCRHFVSPLRAGVQPGEEGLADAISTRTHDGSQAPGAYRGAIRGLPTETASSHERGGHKKGRVRHRLNPVQVQQQALVRRLRTLEARRDWRGVLAAMVRRREIAGSGQQSPLKRSLGNGEEAHGYRDHV